jgi:hypothetical protein
MSSYRSVVGCLALAMTLAPQSMAATEPSERHAHKAARVDRYGDSLPAEAVGRLGTLRLVLGHSVAGGHFLTPDGKMVVAAAPANIRFWDATTAQFVGQICPNPQPEPSAGEKR